jgi:hypothetical protein
VPQWLEFSGLPHPYLANIAKPLLFQRDACSLQELGEATAPIKVLEYFERSRDRGKLLLTLRRRDDDKMIKFIPHRIAFH